MSVPDLSKQSHPRCPPWRRCQGREGSQMSGPSCGDGPNVQPCQPLAQDLLPRRDSEAKAGLQTPAVGSSEPVSQLPARTGLAVATLHPSVQGFLPAGPFPGWEPGLLGEARRSACAQLQGGSARPSLPKTQVRGRMTSMS